MGTIWGIWPRGDREQPPWLSLRNGAKPEPQLPGSENWVLVPHSEPHNPRALRTAPPPSTVGPSRSTPKGLGALGAACSYVSRDTRIWANSEL